MWTLEETRKDYENKPKCSKCKFMTNVIEYDSNNYKNYIECKVKIKKVENEDAMDCEYFTLK